MKKILCLLLAAIMLLGLTACAQKSTALPGTGTPGVTESFEWSSFDKLIRDAQKEPDAQKRADMFREAEQRILKTGAAIPLIHQTVSHLAKPDVTGVYVGALNTLYFYNIAQKGKNGSEPLQIAVCGEPATLDPVIKLASDINCLTANYSVGLLREDENGKPNCALAESYEVSDDGLTYTFHLKPDLKWSDGSALTADDFVFSWKRAAATETAGEANFMFDMIRGYPNDLDVSAPDARTLRVVLSYPCAYFLSVCVHDVYSPVKREQVEGAKGYKDASGKIVSPGAWATEGNIITCGAYTIEKWTHNESIVMKKNPYYYDAENVQTQTLNLMLTSDASAAYNAYQSGGVVLTNMIPSDVVSSLSESPEYFRKTTPGTSYLSFNVKSPLFAGMTAEEAATFRRAIGFAIDRTFLSRVAVSSLPDPAISVVPPGISDGAGGKFGDRTEYTEENGYYSVHADLDKARQMLTSIGFEFGANGKLKDPITVNYLYNGGGANNAVAACLQADLAQLGIRLNLQQVEWNVFLGERKHSTSESFRDGWNSDFNDPYGMLSSFLSDAAGNFYGLGK